MKRQFFILLCFCSSSLLPQNLSLSEYFQQEVNYTITVRLNDKQNSLNGFENIEYTNHSSDTLKYIYFHLWPNAYKNHHTCLARQFLNLGKKDFYFSKPEERGYIDSLNFLVNDQPCKFQTDDDTIDIGILYLNEPLLPSQSIRISTPFYVKIPSAKFSRLGHDSDAYYITQWYPKPAVYDRYGWHPMPYLHNGEFYSEYGHFDVSITLPANYVVAATGNRIAADEEEEFLQNKIKLTNQMIKDNEREKTIALSYTFPASSEKYKTVRFVESNVHDFAWFADKRFLILSDEIKLFESNKKVKTWLYFTPVNLPYWSKALEYINEATLFYSYLAGDYPYNNVSAVDGQSAAGGGMEYPTITIINQTSDLKQLEETIVHEVGHNWFYGIIGSNERDYPAMDEGMNSFYEMRYLYEKYPDARLNEMFGLSKKKLLGIEKLAQKKYYEWSYLILATHNADLPVLKRSTQYTELNYAGIVYAKTAIIMEYLKNYFGKELFDEAIAFYFKVFKYKHPYPQDLKILLDYFGGGDNVPLIENLTTTNKYIDYKIIRVKKNQNNIYDITLKNKGEFAAPVVVQAIKNNKIVAEIWKKDIAKKERFSFPPVEADYFRIDFNEIAPELNRRNNTIRTRGIFKKTEPLQMHFGWEADDFYKTQIYFIPMSGWNFNDGNLLGAAIFNHGIFPKKMEIFLMPLYAFKSQTLTGSGDVYFNFFPSKIFKILQLGIAGKSYTYWYSKNNFTQEKSFSQYIKAEPYINVQFRQKNPLNHRRHFFTLRSVWLSDRNKHIAMYPSNNKEWSWVNEYNYTFINNVVLQPLSVTIKLQHNDLFAKTFLTFDGKIYTTPKKYFEYRLFCGTFLYGKQKDRYPYAFRPAGYSNTQDYMFDYYYFGRYQSDNFYRQQFTSTEGNLKTWTALGYSTEWLGAANLYSPFFYGFRLFADAAVSNEKYLVNPVTQTYQKFLLDAGVQFSIFNVIQINFPFLMSKVLKDNLKLNGFDQWYHWIRYSINIHRLNPRLEVTQRLE